MAKKKGKRDYPQEIEEAAERMKKYPEHLKAARANRTWVDFLINVAGVDPNTTTSTKAQNFWKEVQEKIEPRPAERRSLYKEARQAGMPSKLARRVRDWSEERAMEAIENWKARY